jgi:hypothetical protein
VRRAAIAALLSLASACGPRGYETTEHLEERGQGPEGCAQRCNELGMQMTALVLVDAHMSSCVCQPVSTSGGAAPMSATVAAGAVLEIRRQQQVAAAAAARRTTPIR